MSTIAAGILALLVAQTAEGEALENLVPGGLYDHGLLRPPSKGATPDAFDDGGRVLISIVVPDRGEEIDLGGPSDASLDIQAITAFPEVWFYGPTTSTGKDAVRALYNLVFGILNGAVIVGLGGSCVGLRASGRKGIADDPELSGAVSDRMRLQADGFWA